MKSAKLDLIADRQHHRSLGTDLNTTIQVISVRNTRNFACRLLSGIDDPKPKSPTENHV